MASVTGASLVLFFVSCACGFLLSALWAGTRSAESSPSRGRYLHSS